MTFTLSESVACYVDMQSSKKKSKNIKLIFKISFKNLFLVHIRRLTKDCFVFCIHRIETLHTMSIKNSCVKTLESIISVMRDNNRALKKYIKHERRNKMMRYLATKSSSSSNSNKSCKKKNTVKPSVAGSGYYFFMRSKKTESMSQVMEKIRT